MCRKRSDDEGVIASRFVQKNNSSFRKLHPRSNTVTENRRRRFLDRKFSFQGWVSLLILRQILLFGSDLVLKR